MRHRAIKTEAKAKRPGLRFRGLSSSGGKRLTGGIVVMILTPILDIVNEVVSTIAGSDPVTIANVGSSPSTLSLGECSADGLGTDYVLVTGNNPGSNDVSACEKASEAIIEELLELWSEKLIHSVSDEFKQLVQDIDPANRANKALPSRYQIYCNACCTRINKGYSCVECHDFDLCHDCFIGMKHQDVRRHPYTEFKVQEEISQIQRIMISLRRESVIVEHGRGSHTQCNVCHSMISEPTRLSKRNKAAATYYRCRNCPDFDICIECFPTEAAKNIHEDHKFNMIVATDNQATISCPSPPIHGWCSSGSPRSGSSSYLKAPVGSPDSIASPTLLSPMGYPSLFSPTSPVISRSRSPSCSSVRDPENLWLSGQLFACDACQRNINDDQRLKCVDCDADLHVKCQNWSDRGHERYHRTRVFVKVP